MASVRGPGPDAITDRESGHDLTRMSDAAPGCRNRALHRDGGVAPDLRRPGQQALQDALVWNDKWLPGVLGWLGAAIKCDVSGCPLAKPSPWERSLPPYS